MDGIVGHEGEISAIMSLLVGHNSDIPRLLQCAL